MCFCSCVVLCQLQICLLSRVEACPGNFGSRCDERGLLMIGDPPEMGSYVLPGNNYHVYDIPLFWANTKADVARRVGAFAGGERGQEPAN